MLKQYTPSLPRRPLPAASLLGLLTVAAGTSQAQTLYNASGASLYQTGNLYAAGTVQNAGTYVPSAGTLLIKSGDFTNSGTIGTSNATGTVKLLEPSATQGHTLSLGGQALPGLTLDVPAGTSLGSAGTINGPLTLLNGHLLTSEANALTLGPAASIVGETNAHYVKGRVTQARALSGTAPLDFGSMGFAVNPNGNSLNLSVERRAGLARAGMSYGTNPAMARNQSIDRIWALSSPTATSASALTVTLAWLSDNDNGLNFTGTNTQVWRSDDNGSTWQPQGTVQDGSNRTVSVAITRLNALYTVGTTAAPLPITLTSFRAQKQGDDGLLTWQTASETNSAYFEVQASTNGSTWQPIGRVAAGGKSTNTHAYQHRDPSIARYGAPMVYYRLHQVDTDGTSINSSVVTLSVGALAWQAAAYPNPYTTSLTALLTTAETAPVTITVLDISGRVVLRRETPATIGQQVLPLEEAQALPSGIYTLQVRQNAHLSTLRITKQ